MGIPDKAISDQKKKKKLVRIELLFSFIVFIEHRCPYFVGIGLISPYCFIELLILHPFTPKFLCSASNLHRHAHSSAKSSMQDELVFGENVEQGKQADKTINIQTCLSTKYKLLRALS